MGMLVQEPMVVENAPQRRRGLSKCCCSCSLQAGCIIIGTLTTFNGLYAFLTSVFALIAGGVAMFGYSHDRARLCIVLVLGVLHFATGLSLIYGADKRRTSFMKFWLYTSYVEFTLIVAGSVVGFIILMVNGVNTGSILGVLAYLAIVTGIFLYCIAVVQCFCREVIDSVKNQYLKEEI